MTRRALAIILCLMLLPGLMQAEALPRSRFQGDVLPPDVPRRERVDDSYFHDAVFIGDSIMAGLELHGIFPDSLFAAAVGIGPQNAMGRVYDTNTGRKNLENLLETVDFTKMYVLLGSNTIETLENGPATQRYASFLEKLVSAYPDKLIYVLSILPRMRVHPSQSTPPSLERIDSFNQSIRSMCEAHGIYYLNVFSQMLDEDGQPRRAYMAGDGFHLSRVGSDFVREHLMTHTVKEMP